jgi:hypothetical protein
VIGNGHAGFGRRTLEKGRKAPRPRPTSAVLDPVMGPMSVRVASYFPFNVTCYLNGHSFVAQELRRDGVRFRKADNAFLAVGDVVHCKRLPIV